MVKKLKSIVAICVVISLIASAIPAFAAWDGYVSNGSEKEGNIVTIVDMNDISAITSSTGGAVSSRVRGEAQYTCRWNDHVATNKLVFKGVPNDWTRYQTVRIPIYSSKVTNQQVMLILNCQYEASPTASSSYLSYQFHVDWTGWKVFELNLSNDFGKYNVSTFANVLEIKFDAIGWQGNPNKLTDLYFDSITAELIEESEEEENVNENLTLVRQYSPKDINAFKQALSGGAAVFDFANGVFVDGEVKIIDESRKNTTTKKGMTMVPVNFWKTAFGADIKKSGTAYTITLDGKSITLKENELTEGITCAPFVKEEIFYIPLVETAALFGKKAETKDMLTVVGTDEQLAVFRDSNILSEVGGHLICNAGYDPASITEADFAQLKENWRTYLCGDENNDIEDEYVKVLLKKTDSGAKGTLESMNRSADAKVLFGTKVCETSDDMYNQFMAMYRLAKAYGTYGSEYYQDPVMREAIEYSLEWLYNNLYGQAEIDGTGWRDIGLYNWWDWYIGVPRALTRTLLILEEDMLQTQIEKYLKLFEHIRKTTRLEKTLTYAQGRIEVVTASALLHEDAELLAECMYDFDLILQPATKLDGVYDDYTYIMHTVYPLEGSYGPDVLIARFMSMASILSGSKFEITSPQKYNQILWMKNLFRAVMHNGTIFTRSLGRGPDGGTVMAKQVVRGAVELLGCFGEEEDLFLKKMIKEHASRDTMLEIINIMDTIPNAMKLVEVMNDDSITGFDGEYLYTDVRHNGDRALQHANGYSVDIAMSSERIATYESINGENKKGWHQADGALYVYNDNTTPTHDQFGTNFWNNANMYRIPGTTEDTQERKVVSINPAYLPPKSFVGGADMDESYAAVAFDFEAYHHEAPEEGVDEGYGGPLPQHFSDLVAQKSYFLFDDEIVAVGSDINSTNNAEVNTYVDNRELYEKYVPPTATTSTIKPYDVVKVTAAGTDGNLPENVLDGNIDTRWSYQSPTNGWITLELPEVLPVGYVGVAVYNGAASKAIFDIELSEDGVNFTKVFSGKSSGTTIGLEGYDCKGMNAKYVRYVGSGRENSQWNSVTEIQVYPPRADNKMVFADSVDTSGTIYGTEDIIVDGVMLSKEAEINKKYENPSWVHMENFGGYFFPNGGKVALHKTDSKNSFFELWLEHGLKPQKETYSYIMLPNKTVEQTKEYVQNPDVVIEEYNDKIHVVREKSLGITAIVFWEAGSYGNITVTEPMVLIVKEQDGKYKLSVADPTKKLSYANIFIKENLEPIELDDEIKLGLGDIGKELSQSSGNKYLPVSKTQDTTTLTVNFNGAGGKSLIAEFTKW